MFPVIEGPINELRESCGMSDERGFTKAEISDRVEIGAMVTLEKERNGRLRRDLIKATDDNRSSDPFGGGLDESVSPLQKRARSFYGLRRSLSDEETEIVRAHFATSPSILEHFEKNQVAVRIEDGRVASFNLAAA